jgi:formate hydrogenlyase transcriptional activator
MSTAGFGFTPLSHFVSTEVESSLREQSELEVTRARLALLMRLTKSAATRGTDEVFTEATAGLRRVTRSDFVTIGLLDTDSGALQVAAFESAYSAVDYTAAESLSQALGQHVSRSGEAWTGNEEDCGGIAPQCRAAWAATGVQWICVQPLVARRGVLGTLAVGRRGANAYTNDEVEFLAQVATQVALALDNTLGYPEVANQESDNREESASADEDPASEPSLAGVVGKSAALRRVLRQVEIVAPTDSGVLVQGETGTGKELIARAIHDLSSRRDRPFVKLNCAAIPSGLLESELFGHEKGAFTGAIMRKAGRFEAADKGTLFLDEVGDIPLELQPKLLRVLQEHEFERLGSTRTQHVDVRVIAATHRDLKRMVEDGLFRSDLYYRLHVFPLVVPALRDRRDDIPLLVRHYVNKYAQRMQRQIHTIPAAAMEALANYDWPGNVRELQNCIERAVILSPGGVLRLALEELKQAVPASSSRLSTLEEAEREHVMRAIRESKWVIGGPNGAAARLGMKRTTLCYRIRKLGIPVRPQ